jgi:glycosyltransferase involved in cell wall biosynthesis
MTPFFSISIPTYNRPHDLKNALQSLLRQTYSNFEIIVCDNSSNNKSQKVVESFQDKRIKYFKNRENIGFARNLYKAIKKAKGQYIFLFGDDDCLLNKDALSRLFFEIKANKYGYIRLNFVYHRNFKVLFDFNKFDGIKNRTIEKKSSNWEILKFLLRSNFALISGIIFKRPKKIHISEIEKSQDPNFTMEIFWIDFLFEQAKKYGALIDTENTIIGQWIIHMYNSACADKTGPSIYAVLKNQIYVEKSWKLIFPKLTDLEIKQWIKEQTEMMIVLFPSIKFYSNNRILLSNVKRMLELNHSLFLNPFLYIYLFIAVVMPKTIWNHIRVFFQNKNLIDNHLNIELADFRRFVLRQR